MRVRSLVLTLVTVLAGCAADMAVEDGSGLDAYGGKADGVDDRENTDVQVLQAWRSDQVVTGEDLDLEACKVLETYEHGTVDDRRDCTEQAEALIGPLAHPVHVRTYLQDGVRTALRFRCSVTEIRTVTAQAALDAPSFTGLGFYHNERSELRSIGRERLDERDYGAVTLREGNTPARVHGFAALSACWRGTFSSSYYHRESFKPFAEYVSEDGTKHRRWEAHDDHALGQVWGYGEEGRTQSFDRARELLTD